MNGKLLREDKFVCYLVGRKEKKTFRRDLSIFHQDLHKTFLSKMERKEG